MLRNLQNMSNVNVDASKKSAVVANIKRGTFVQKDEVNGTFILPISVSELYMLDRDTKVTKSLAYGEPYSDYDDEQDIVAKDEFAGLVSLQKGTRWATSEYDSTLVDADVTAGKYLTVSITVDEKQGKLIKSASATAFKSLGWITDNGHTLLGFELV